MTSRSLHVALWRGIRHTWRGALALLALALVSAAVFRWYRGATSLEDVRWQALLTVAGVALGAWLASILVAGLRRMPKTALAGLIALLASQVFYLLLVWTQLKPHAWLWRSWWIAWVASVAMAHVAWSRFSFAGRGNWVGRATIACTVLAAVLVGGLALRPTLLEETPLPWLIAMIACIALSALGSTVLWVAARRRRPRAGVSRLQKLGWVLAAQAAMFGFGFYAGRVTAPAPSTFDLAISPLANKSPDELDASLAMDMKRLRIVADGIDDLAGKAHDLSARIRAARSAEKRSYYLPAEEDELKAQFMTYLAYRSALLRMAANYAGFASVDDPALRGRCFLVGYGAGATVMRGSTMLISAYAGDDAVRRKLNEPDDACGLRAGEFDRIHDAVISERNAQLFEEMSGYFARNRAQWRSQAVLPPEQLDWVEGHIARCIAEVHAVNLDRSRGRLRRLAGRVRQDIGAPIYDAQSIVSTWIGDTRMVQRDPFITKQQILSIQPKLRPGDIFLERRDFFLSNAFLPGFWPHAALYIGTTEDLEKLGLVRPAGGGRYTSDVPAIRDRLAELLRPAIDHQPNTVLESVSEGVIFNSLTHSMHADYVAVLRPRLGDAQRAKAIATAFSHQGKPYDFEFDFFSSDKLVCTELVYRSYEGLLHFNLVRIMGRDTLPALEICRKFAAERRRADDQRELDFVLFLDAVPEESRAAPASVESFCSSADRPRAFNE